MTEPDADDILQRYFDGDLPPDEAESLRLRLEDEPELQAKLDGLAHLRTLLRAALAPERLEGLDADAMFRSIEGLLATEPEVAEAVARPGLRVVPGGKDDAILAKPVRSRAPMWFGVGGLALAAAAALWFFVLRPGQRDGVPGDEDDPVVMAAPPPGSEIEQIDFGYSTGAIFSVEDEGAQYAVIWISDEKPDDVEEPEAPDAPEDRIQ